MFAGNDCSVALAKMSFDSNFLNQYGKKTLSLQEQEVLEDWFQKIKNKYKAVGTIEEGKKNL